MIKCFYHEGEIFFLSVQNLNIVKVQGDEYEKNKNQI